MNKVIAFTDIDTTLISDDIKPIIDRERVYMLNMPIQQIPSRIYWQDMFNIKYINAAIGWGVFSKQDIKKDKFLGEYTGILERLYALDDGKYAFIYPVFSTTDKLVVNANTHGNYLRYVNHGRPNVKVKYMYDGGLWRLCFFATKTIHTDEQVLLNYGKRYWMNLGRRYVKL